MSESGIESQLRQRLSELAASPPDGWVTAVLTYFSLLQRWNRSINLSGFTLDPPSADAIDRLLVEPLLGGTLVDSSLPAGQVGRVLDIGSGGGSPAVPLALALRASGAGTNWLTMVESRQRKAVFLREALRAVDLNGDVLAERFDELVLPGASYQLICSRAVRLEDADALKVLELLAPGGRLLLYHGVDGPGQAVDLRFTSLGTRQLTSPAGIATVYAPR